MPHPLITQHRAAIRDLAAQRGISDIRVFGSMARGDANSDSDIDLLVTLPPECSGLTLGGLLLDIQTLTHRRVDIVTAASLHPAIRERVLDEALAL